MTLIEHRKGVQHWSSMLVWPSCKAAMGTAKTKKEYLQNDQQAIRDSSVIFVAPYWRYRISCLKVQLAPLAQGADSEK